MDRLPLLAHEPGPGRVFRPNSRYQRAHDPGSGRRHAEERKLHHGSGPPAVFRRFPADSERDLRRRRYGGATNPGRIEYFLKQTLDYPEGHFDGVLVWDVLEYLNPRAAERGGGAAAPHRAAEGLHAGVLPLRRQAGAVPFYTFRIEQLNSLEISQQGMRRPAQLYQQPQPGEVIRQFESVKFFLTRERLREVIIKV